MASCAQSLTFWRRSNPRSSSNEAVRPCHHKINRRSLEPSAARRWRTPVKLESLWTKLDELLLPVLRSYRERLPTLEVSEKADRTLLSEADLAAQRLIVETILAAF